ncbi:MAG: class I SAM-dependent methyltransferase [Bacteroidales bacterium]|nr:class I SAM-dependent methyltransferase [Bacteroidales bacterium]
MKMQSLSLENEKILSYVRNLGPEKSDYNLLHCIAKEVNNSEKIQSFREIIKPILTNDSLFGYTFNKPFGYAGDFILIEKIYQHHISSHQKYVKWDKFYHSLAATNAVRNRKDYFINEMERISKKLKRNLNVLILGSGPATDLEEYLKKYHLKKDKFTLLDIDAKAIMYSRIKLSVFGNNINYIKKNVLRFISDEKYDLIWSAGLFDYLNDRFFVGLTKRLINNLTPYGEMIIGNFSDDNPTKNVMEVFGDWYLHYRSGKHLINLAKQAGAKSKYISIDNEKLGVNLFLKVQS